MNRRIRIFILLIFSSIALYSCSSVRNLPEGQTMLVKNDVKVVDAKSPDFDNLKSYVRPVTNKRFMDMILIKTVFYDWGQPTYDKNGNTKDSKFKKYLREKVGEPPVLLDSLEIYKSLDQLKIVMRQLGYFDAEVSYKVTYTRKDLKKAKVEYFVTAHEPYHISHVEYDIPIQEYKRIVVLNKDACLLTDGMQYNETVINDELTRIINLIRDEGYYYVEKSLIRCEVQYDLPDSLGVDPKSVNITVLMKIPESDNQGSRYLYKYYYNDVYVNPDASPSGILTDICDTNYYQLKTRQDSANFYFIEERIDGEKLKPYFSYKALSNAIFTRTGQPYSQMSRSRSSRALSSLDNFDYTNIQFRENDLLLDTVNKVGYLDVVYQMIRKKEHSFGGQIELRNDKSDLSFSYTNRNLFKGAEHFTINLSGGYFYYSLSNLFKRDKIYSYPEFGLSASLEFPNRLFLFSRNTSEKSISRSTSFTFGLNYSGLYQRLMYNTALTYRWSPTYFISHTLSPIEVSTINMNNQYIWVMNLDAFPESYQRRFGKFFLLSAKYSFNFLVPKFIDSRKHNMHLNVNLESTGLLLRGLNLLFNRDQRWIIGVNGLDEEGYSYTNYEKFDILWNYTYTINNDNAVAMRAAAGFIIPLDKDSYVPYEKGFYLGTSNSMRGWGYRGLGPGSYERNLDSLYTGDIKLEFNFEYRGTIYRSFKYGVFTDIGNIWLSRKSDDMPGAEFAFNRFYKELAVDVGVGIRLDFDFFVIRVDYALPIYDPTRGEVQGRFFNKKWFSQPHKIRLLDGLKIAIGYAF